MKQDLSVFFLKKSAQVQLYIQVIILIKDLSMRLDKWRFYLNEVLENEYLLSSFAKLTFTMKH